MKEHACKQLQSRIVCREFEEKQRHEADCQSSTARFGYESGAENDRNREARPVLESEFPGQRGDGTAAAGPRPAGVVQRGPLAVAQRPAEGFGLQWRDDACLACGANDGGVAALRLDPSGACAVDVEWAPAPGAVEDVAWSPTEATVLMTCGSAAGALRVLDARTASRAMLTRADAHGAADVNALSWNRSVAYLVATAGDDGCARVFLEARRDLAARVLFALGAPKTLKTRYVHEVRAMRDGGAELRPVLACPLGGESQGRLRVAGISGLHATPRKAR